MQLRLNIFRLSLISTCLAIVNGLGAFAEEPHGNSTYCFSRENVYLKTLATHLIRNGFSKSDHVSAEAVIAKAILRESNQQAYVQINNTISLLRPSKVIGFETASDSQKGFKAFWLCKSNDRKITLILHDPQSQVTKVKWNASDAVQFDKAYGLLSSVMKESEVVGESNTTHGTINMFTIGDDSEHIVSLRYPSLPWSDKGAPNYEKWREFREFVEAITTANEDKK